MKRLFDEVVEDIENDRFCPFYGWHCNFCDYKVACEEYSQPHYGGPRIDLEGRIIGAEEFYGWDADVPSWIETQVEGSAA